MLPTCRTFASLQESTHQYTRILACAPTDVGPHPEVREIPVEKSWIGSAVSGSTSLFMATVLDGQIHYSPLTELLLIHSDTVIPHTYESPALISDHQGYYNRALSVGVPC